MADAIVLEHYADADWYVRLHVMANTPEALETHRATVPAWGTVKVEQDSMRVHHLRAYWPMRGPITLPVTLGYWPMVAWWVGDGKVSQAMIDGASAFALAYGLDPMCAFVRTIPAKAQEFVEVRGVVLVQAGWVPNGFVAIARGGMTQFSTGKQGG